MATNRAFRRQAESKKAEKRAVVTFDLMWESDTEVDENGDPVIIRSDTFTARMPSDERLFLIAAMAGDSESEGMGEAAATLDLFRAALSEKEFRVLRARLKDERDDVDLSMLTQVMEWLMEEWTDFPTQPSSASSGSQQRTGPKSTGRVRGSGSTRSN